MEPEELIEIPPVEETSATTTEEMPTQTPSPVEEISATTTEEPPSEDTLTLEEITSAPEPEREDILTLDDILNDQSLKQAKENADRELLLSIGTQSPQALKPILVQWAQRGFPSAYPIYSVNITPPSVCLDGVTRSLYDYITYVSGKTIAEHVCDLCCKLRGMHVGFANINGAVTIVVSKED